MSYDEVAKAGMMPLTNGLQPTQLILGPDEMEDILRDDNVMRPQNMTTGGAGGVTRVAGMDVVSSRYTGMRAILAQKPEEDNVKYYLY